MIKLIMIVEKFLFLFLFFVLTINAKEISVSQDIVSLPILDKSKVFIASENYTLEDVVEQRFDDFTNKYINLGLTKDTIWVKFTLKNASLKTVNKMLVISNPLLTVTDMYKVNQVQFIQLKQKRTTLSPSYMISLSPNSKTDFYLHVKSFSSVKFGLYLYDIKKYKEQDLNKQLINILFIGIVFTMMIYNFLLFFYIRDISYLFYSIYLFIIILLEASYIGLIQMFLPERYIFLDSSFLLGKVNLLVIFYILYTLSFLKIEKRTNAVKLGFFLIIMAISNNFFLFLDYAQILKFSLLNAIMGIVLIFTVSIFSYINNQKEARFFIAGFVIVAIAYIIVILDALGLISLLYHMQNILIVATAIEAILLSIAFVDSYRLLQASKLQKEQQFADESQKREQLINKEVAKKTDQLQHAMVVQDLLFNELHHRVKNNLQLILSITRLQKEQIENLDFKEQFASLENRINAIATTHNTIYLSKNLEIISMEDYIVKLTNGLKASDLENKIAFNYEINLNMTLKKAINVGLIINELVSNALKHAFKDIKGMINIILKDGYLEISDNGNGYNKPVQSDESLGMKLVTILVKDQLKGTLKIDHTNGTKIIIRFENG